MFVEYLFLTIYTALFMVTGLTFTLPVFASMPGVYTQMGSNFGTNSATLMGHVSPQSGVDTVRWFEWGLAPEIPLSNRTPVTRNGMYSENFTESISNLSPNTMYFFRAVAQNASGTAYGNVVSFKTKGSGSGQVAISTNSASSVNEFSAVAECYIDPQGNTSTQRWVEWGRDASVGAKTEKIYQVTPGSYSAGINGLTPNTAYYFRCAAATGQYSAVIYGNTLNFTTRTLSVSSPQQYSYGNTTSSGGYNANTSNTNGTVSQVAVTKIATDITNTGARLNAVALPGSASLQTYGWFEWGGTPNLGYTSTKRFLGAGTPISFSESISGLTPGTAYFFKAVAENQNGRFEGTVFSFRTAGTAPIAPVSSNISNQTASAIQSSFASPVKTEPKPVTAVSHTQKTAKETVSVEVIPNTDTAAPKERINETIQLENTTDTAVKEVTVRVVLPCDVVFVQSDNWTQNGTMLTHKTGDLKPNEKISLILSADVGANVVDKTPMETIVVVDWRADRTTSDTESVGRATITVDKNKIAKGSVAAVATTQKSSSFFPSNLKDWGAVIGILFLLFAAYMVFLVIRQRSTDEREELDGSDSEDTKTHPALGMADVSQMSYANDPFVTHTAIQQNKITVPMAPTKQTLTQKSAPPENLPI